LNANATSAKVVTRTILKRSKENRHGVADAFSRGLKPTVTAKKKRVA